MKEYLGEKYKVAAVQASSVLYDREKSLEKAISLIEEAASNDAQLAVLPESYIPGYPYHIWMGAPWGYHELFKEWFNNSVEVPSRTTDALCEAARKNNIFVTIGISERDGNTCYNTILYINNKGQIFGKHRKLMPTHVERVHWGQGDGSYLNVYDTELGKMSGLVCWEHTMDLVRHSLIAQRAQIHCGVWVGFSSMPGWENLFDMSTELASRYHAHVGECFVVTSQSTISKENVEKLAQTDYQKEWIKPGGGWSAIIAPGGSILAGPLKGEEGILYADIDMQMIADMAHWHDATGHYSRPDVASLLLNKDPYQVARSINNFDSLGKSFDQNAINQPSPEQLLKKIQQLEEKYSELLTSDLNNPTRLLSPTPR
ncbi:carbon-nitrogen hydrolase family protein [Niallia endozanthoxylica]|uniref:Carbon-nitrogen hydrolase family protein n=1 Tax=Niallia endozanthoxylica TaxID=2036016 RepID=A0A5J5HFQ8_9BACI|nr:carbon-nitrogen hydrolase family protein [Niallia endozanthoxylica]KAA9019007.1 carbon-nitrogen hydrolase family protein [Niallia endozanthoxylica]